MDNTMDRHANARHGLNVHTWMDAFGKQFGNLLYRKIPARHISNNNDEYVTAP